MNSEGIEKWKMVLSPWLHPSGGAEEEKIPSLSASRFRRWMLRLLASGTALYPLSV